ncbi:MAG: EF2563 family selenium-dependent molybdenum hydroxylase system protein [Ardenticatenaceae bacterium]|nr:EF2563 family selenium-dependent molybdenum hydroxylase system protein [Ardenticatenaceae bacterium]
MLFSDQLVLIRGGGDLATGVAYRLHQAGFPIIVLELERPLVVRRKVALATAVLAGSVQIEDLHGQLVHSVAEAEQLVHSETVPVLVAPDLAPVITHLQTPISILVDARIAKRNIDTHISQAPLVIGMGPGFTAGVDCHAVIETMRGHSLGRVYWAGSALPNTGTPGIVAGKGAERVLRAPQAGKVNWQLAIGDSVEAGNVIGDVDGVPVLAPFAGVVRGLIAAETAVTPGLKIGDVDPRGIRDHCFTISDKALALGGAVLSAILAFHNRQNRV